MGLDVGKPPHGRVLPREDEIQKSVPVLSRRAIDTLCSGYLDALVVAG